MSTVSTLPRPASLYYIRAPLDAPNRLSLLTTLESFMVHAGASAKSYPYPGSAHDRSERTVDPRNGFCKPVGSNVPQNEVFP